MKYRNTITGAIVVINSKVIGGNWELVGGQAPSPLTDEKKVEPKKTTRRKKEK